MWIRVKGLLPYIITIITFIIKIAIIYRKNKGKSNMKRVDFENGTITKNILGTAIPMLAAQILSLL